MRDEFAALVELQGAEVRDEFGGRGAEQCRERKRTLFGGGAEVEFDRAGGAVEAIAVTLRARLAVVGDVFGGVDAEFA